MQVLYPRCAGLDVHKDIVVACRRLVQDDGVHGEVRTFKTTTKGLLALLDWLGAEHVTHVAMEATGVYWKPVWHVLEDAFVLVLGNAHHIRNVPGRKTDVNDATWIAQLLAHGLISASFVPPSAIQQVRELTRSREQLVREMAQHTLRIEKTLEDANIKITGLITDILGISGRAILDAIVAGQTDPEQLSSLLRGRLKQKRQDVSEALAGRVTEHHRFMIGMHLELIDTLRASINVLEKRIDTQLEPHRAAVQQLTTIPGVSLITAWVILAEIGTDMSRFPSAGHLLSWAGLCPRNDESAGKRRSSRIRKGAPWLKPTLIQAAWAAVRKKNSYERALYGRLRARRGSKKAIVAVAASMLTATYHMLKDGTCYQDLGPNHFNTLDSEKLAMRLSRRLKDLGYEVQLSKVA